MDNLPPTSQKLIHRTGAEQTLSDLPSGTCAVINRLLGGNGFAARIVAMGFIQGAEIKVIQNSRWGPVLVEVQGARVALGRGEAAKIRVIVQ